MNAVTKIYERMSRQLYKKEGRKYVPVDDPYALDGLREGWWLVKVSQGFTSIRQCVRPARAELDAAIRDKVDQIVPLIIKAGEARPQKAELSEEARKDWKAFIAKHGSEFNVLAYPSAQEHAEKILAAILGEEVQP